MTARGEADRPEARRPRAPDVSRAGLERAALGYLERFDSSVANLRRVLRERVRRARQRSADPIDTETPKREIETLLARYQESGLLNDRRFGSNLLSGLRRRGVSTRAARLKLLSKGVPEDLVSDLLSVEAEETSGDSEFEAALAYVKKRRLGHYRRATSSAEATAEGDWQEPGRLPPKKAGFGRAKHPEAARRDKDLAALARRGFSFDVARRALDTPRED
ncbi:MAG: RecX family transcriptional regulator [Myxococcales bacterium]|nr:RecX family transcriptional regulator [Myxococcales bacterium]